MATGDLTSLAAAKDWLGITDDGRDALLTRLVAVASSAIRNALNRPTLAPADYDLVLDGTGTRSVVPRIHPITAVSSVVLDGVAIPAAAGPADAGFRWNDTAVFLTGGAVFSRGRGNLRIALTAGQPVPAEVEQACLLTVQAMLSSRDLDPNLSSEGTAGYSAGFRETAGAIPPAALRLLAPHRRVF